MVGPKEGPLPCFPGAFEVSDNTNPVDAEH